MSDRKPGRPRKPITHGTTYAYLKHKCRCEPCRTAMSAYQRQYRKNNFEYFERINERRRAKKRDAPVTTNRSHKPRVFTDRQLEIAAEVIHKTA